MKSIIVLQKILVTGILLLVLKTSLANDTLVKFATAVATPGSSWKYLDNGTDLGATTWKLSSYSDATWSTGNSELGYGDGDENTTVGYGSNASNRYITTYFRKTINIANPATYTSFKMDVKRDDGIIVYINGVEAYRNNLATASTYATLATTASDDGETILSVSLPASGFVAGDNVIAVEIHQSSITSTDISFDMNLVGITPPPNIFMDFATSTTAPGSSWKYLANGTDIGATTWKLSSYSDASWSTGNSELGYGDGDENTTVSYGSNASNRYITTYFRKTINITNPAIYTSFKMDVKRDDGIVVYINGTEAYRNNLATASTYTTLATNASDDGETILSVSLPATAFVAGNNVIAVEIHQTSITSTDISFDMRLEGITTIPVAPVVSSAGTASGSVGASFSYNITASNTPTAYAATGLPAGLSVNTTTGLISGTPTASGNFNTTITASNGGGAGSKSLVITIAAPASAVLTRGPYLQMGNQTAITIRWRTDVATDSKVTWGVAFGTYTNSLTDPVTTKEHIVRITGLTADTKYFYAIGSSSLSLQSANNNYFVTAPPANTTRKLRFLALGDCGNNSTNQVNVKNTFINYIGTNTVDAMILLGDNAYNTGLDTEFQTNFFDVYKNDILRYNKLYPAPGNHDYGNTQSNAGVRNNAYYNSFTMPTAAECGGVASGTKAYYSFDIGSVHFISLDSYGKENSNSTRVYDTTGAQVVWLKADLAANTKKWTVVFFHHPPHTKAGHDSDTESELVSIRQKLTPILERYGVDLVLCGHAHGYERSYLLKGYTAVDASFNKNIHTPKGDTLNALYNGTTNSCPYNYNSGIVNHGSVYIVSGSAGQIGGTSSGYPHNAMRYSNNSNGGCFYFEVDSNRLDAKFISYSTAPTPVVRDQFTIFKDVNRVQKITVTQNAALILTASWRGNYYWPNNGATSQSVNISTAIPGTFQYTVRDNNTCIKDSFYVTVTPLVASRSAAAIAQDKKELSVKVLTSALTGSTDLLINDSNPGKVQMKLFETSGKMVIKEEIRMNTGSTMKQLQLRSGVYIVELINDKAERVTARFMVL